MDPFHHLCSMQKNVIDNLIKPGLYGGEYGDEA
jgi:hypothetical protein